MRKFRIGEFTILPFDTKHGVSGSLGFFIQHKNNNILFFTDTLYLPYKFKDITNILGEINYSESILNEKLELGHITQLQANRTVSTHMSLETFLDFCRANDLSHCNNIVLLHLSSSNSNAEQFKKIVCEATGKNVLVADKNMIISLDSIPF
jgi:phosphoribosyl 1,2-cyclic phosphodiesterase